MKIDWIAWPSILSAVAATGLGLFVLSRNPRGFAHRGFAAAMAAMAIAEAGHGMALLSSTGSSFLFWRRIALTAEFLLPVSWFAFLLVFGRNDPKAVWKRWRFPLLGFSLLMVAFSSLLNSEYWIQLLSLSDPPPPVLKLGSVGYGVQIYLLLASALVLHQLENTYRSASESQRWQIKFLLIGIATFSMFMIYTSSHALLFRSLFLQLIPIQSLVRLTALGLIAFALVRHRNLEVSVFVSRQVVYGSTIVVLVGLYLIGVGLLSKALDIIGSRIHPFFTPLIVALAVTALLILLASGLVRRRIALFISEHFYKHKYDFHLKWLEATARLGSKRTIPELVPAIIGFLRETLGATSASVWLYEKERQRFVKADPSIPPSLLRTIPANEPLLRRLRGEPRPIRLDEIQAPPTEEAIDLLHSMKAEVLIPLIAGDRLIGFMTVGPDMTGKPYVQNDYDLMKAVGNQIAYQLLNARMAEELAGAKELEAFHEVSTFVIHDLKNLTNTLSLMLQNAPAHFHKPAFRADALQTLAQIVEKLKSFILRLSGLSKTFKLNRSLEDLNALVLESMATLDGVMTADIVEDLPPLPALLLDHEQIKAALVNLLINAQEAIHATGKTGTIRISTLRQESWVVVTVADTGCGMSASFIQQQLFRPFRTTKSLGLGVGLFQTKKIIEGHDGLIDVQSEEGKGTTFSIRLPVPQGG